MESLSTRNLADRLLQELVRGTGSDGVDVTTRNAEIVEFTIGEAGEFIDRLTTLCMSLDSGLESIEHDVFLFQIVRLFLLQ